MKVWRTASAKPTATVWLAACAMLAVAINSLLLAFLAAVLLAVIGMAAVTYFSQREVHKVHVQCDHLDARVEQLVNALQLRGIPVPPAPVYTEGER